MLRLASNDDVPSLDPRRRWLGPGGRRELALSEVKLVLESREELALLYGRVRQGGDREAQVGTQLVERAERGDPCCVLRYAGTAHKGGLTAVAGAGIEPRTTRASGRHGKTSSGEFRPWTGQNERCSTSLCFAS